MSNQAESILDRMLQAKQEADSVLIMDKEQYLYQMFLGDCQDKGLEPTVDRYVEWKSFEYPLVIEAESWVDNLGRTF